MHWRVIMAVLFACLILSIWGDLAQGADATGEQLPQGESRQDITMPADQRPGDGAPGPAESPGSFPASPPNPLLTQPVAEGEEEDPGDWDVIPYAYGWLPWINLEGSTDDSGISIREGPDDLLKALKGGFMLGVEVEYKRRWLAGIDALGIGLNFNGETDASQHALGPANIGVGPALITIPSITANVFPLDTDFDLRLLLLRGIVGYRLVSMPIGELFGGQGQGDERRLDLDVYAGGRLWLVRYKVDITGPPIEFAGTTGKVSFPGMPGITLPEFKFPASGSGPIDIHDKETVWWIDPLFGARIKADLTDRVYLHLNGNVGGFDWGSASKFSWEALSTVGMRFKEHWAVEAGYKGIGEERDKGDLEVNLIFHGPIVALSYRF